MFLLTQKPCAQLRRQKKMLSQSRRGKLFSSFTQSLRPHGLQHARLPCPTPTPGAYSNSCPSSQWCHLILCQSLLLLSSIFHSIRAFSSESVIHIRWPKYWSFSFSISPSNEYSGLISFRMDWFDLLAVQGTLKSLFQHHSSTASILQCSAFFIVQISESHMTAGKKIALTRQTFVGKVISLLFNVLSRLVIVFLPRSNHVLIFWLQSPSAMILVLKKIVYHCFHCSPIFCIEMIRPDAMVLVFWMLDFKPNFQTSLSLSSSVFLP